MTNKSLLYIFFFILIIGRLLEAFPYKKDEKEKYEAVIQINDRKISIDEFQSRLNDLPLPSATDLNELKENLLCTLITETILYYEGLKEKLDTIQIVKKYLNQYNDEALYEDWMNKEVKEQVKLTEPEITEAYRRFKEERYVEFWTARGINEANNLRSDLLKDTISNVKSEFKKLNYSESLEEVENTIYNLKENEISEPIPVDSLFYIFKLISRTTNEQHAKGNYQYWKPAVEKILRERKEKGLLADKLTILMGSKSFSLQKEPFDYVYDKLKSIVYEANTSSQSAEVIQQELNATKVNPSISNSAVVIFNDNSVWTVDELWEKLSVSPHPLNFKNPDELKPGLVEVINKLFLLESVSSDAQNKGYDSAGFVKTQNAMWKANLVAQALIEMEKRNIQITNAELLKFFDEDKKNYIKAEQRKIFPIILKDEPTAKEVYGKLNEGADFSQLAKEYSINNLGQDEANPGIYISKEYWGDAGKAAFNLKPGEHTAPIRLHDGSYMIIKLLEIKSSSNYSFDEIKDNLAVAYQDKKLQERIESLLNSVVPNYKIKINKSALTRVTYYGGNLGIKKTHFPLRNVVPGFPYFYSNAKWFKTITDKH